MPAAGFPPAFTKQMAALLSTELDNFEASLATAPPVSIRVNPGKSAGLNHLPMDGPVPWHPDGRYLAERPSFTLDPLFHAGAYYVQEASSMFLYQALEQTTGPKRPLRILDLCAAPGGKTTLIASWMPAGSILVANEVIRSRVPVLKQNLGRWGHPAVFTCNYDPEAFLPLAGWFDVVVVDAPCSGEGLFRKNESASQEWSPENVLLCAARQKRILQVAQKLVGPGGALIYSTCTYNSSENDQNADWLVREKGMYANVLDIPAAWQIGERQPGYQFYPHKVKGEGFYLAPLRQLEPIRSDLKARREFRKMSAIHKKEVSLLKDWIEAPDQYFFLKTKSGEVCHAPAELEPALRLLDHALPAGVWLHETGQIKGSDFVPAHELALEQEILRKEFPAVALDEQQALQYLKKELLSLPVAGRGWQKVTYGGLALGWIRNLGNRFNNYFPTEQRIRMSLQVNDV